MVRASEPGGQAVTGRNHVVVGVDGSPGSRRALAWAAEEAALRRAVLDVVVVGHSPHHRGAGPSAQAEAPMLAGEAAARLDEAAEEVSDIAPGLTVEKLALDGDPARILCDRSSEAAMLVVGSRGRGGLTGALLGSVSTKCAHHSKAPVVIVPEPHPRRRGSPHARQVGTVVVGIDRSPGSQRALSWAVEEARFHQWTIEAIEAWRDPYGGDMTMEFDLPHFRRERTTLSESVQEQLDTFVLEVTGGDPPVKIGRLIVDGEPDAVLCARSAAADLLVVGSRGRGGVARVLLGSVSNSCAHHSSCPIAIVAST